MCIEVNKLVLVLLVKFESICVLVDGEVILVCVIVLVGKFELMILMAGLIDKDVELDCLVKEIVKM